jgi:hypothetical protein
MQTILLSLNDSHELHIWEVACLGVLLTFCGTLTCIYRIDAELQNAMQHPLPDMDDDDAELGE